MSASQIQPSSTTARLTRTGLALALAGSLGACSSLSETFSSNKVDYKSASSRSAPLDVPPDLSQLSRDPRYQQPGPGTVVSAAALQSAGQASVTAGTPAPVAVAVQASQEARIERSGNQRWLVTGLTPEQVWPLLRTFWTEGGFTLAIDQADVGTMETEWAENRARLPQDFIRRSVGRVLDGLYDSGQRDRYRTRVERSAQGTEITISHRSAVEELVGERNSDRTRWVIGPNDPNLEAEFLGRLLVKLSATTTASSKPADTVAAAIQAVAKAPEAPARARLLDGQPAATLQVDENYDRTWRRVGLALDRAGFTVEDRDRKAGLIDMRYVDPKLAGTEEPGFFARLFGKDDRAARAGVRYRVRVTGMGDSASTVSVLDSEGRPRNDDGARSIIQTLLLELR
ncbi:outer membrane protein assembly factor BamC [Sphaerotilus hippei]|uniref:outer membrane protein assembly factor BamC n=1 Tax=Sphaerotilus hippei TaxID=744406 RepID=UPI001FE290CE|nr:outer membrane protein assembly factor BamC [Sphaerotilus hippei]